VKDL